MYSYTDKFFDKLGNIQADIYINVRRNFSNAWESVYYKTYKSGRTSFSGCNNLALNPNFCSLIFLMFVL